MIPGVRLGWQVVKAGQRWVVKGGTGHNIGDNTTSDNTTSDNTTPDNTTSNNTTSYNTTSYNTTPDNTTPDINQRRRNKPARHYYRPTNSHQENKNRNA
ncbi:hypothetical protein Pmani_039928 [Petrolisthes manimaculis]|uniref:Uncharacterized protein n=1 Tax=Petrolisthes manimaculis TaxID=1843537 RepID=A0AAE1ND43_9EUCA|nr:hypothetical protein Pmani_039928 [Petrolisthes manimaculis]